MAEMLVESLTAEYLVPSGTASDREPNAEYGALAGGSTGWCDGGRSMSPSRCVWWAAATLRLVSDMGHPVRAIEVQRWRQPAGRATARAFPV